MYDRKDSLGEGDTHRDQEIVSTLTIQNLVSDSVIASFESPILRIVPLITEDVIGNLQ